MHLISPVENMGTNSVEFINGCANWHGFYEIHHYALQEGLYNFLIYVKLRFVYCTVCQDLLYIFIKKGLVGFFFNSWFISILKIISYSSFKLHLVI